MNTYLKGFADPDLYMDEAKSLNCKCKFVGILEPRARERTWVVAFYENKFPSDDELLEMFKTTFELNEKQSIKFLEHDLGMGDFV